MKKIAIISLAVLLPLACTKEVQEPVQGEETRKEADIRQVTVTAGQEVVNTRTFFNKSNGQITWNTSESPMAIFDGSGKQTFSHAGTTDDGLHASFSGSADVNAATWTAVHPAANAAWDDGKVYVSVPCVQQARLNGGLLSDMNTTAALVTHDGDGNLDNFVMKNVGGLLKLTVAESNIKSITVSSINKEPLTGKAELSFDAAGNPVVTPVSCQYETFVTLIPHKTKMEGSFPAGDYFVSIFPVAMEGGLIIDMEKTDGTVASVRSSSVASVARSADLEFAGFDTVASWYTPEETTLSLNFVSGWPFNETIVSGGNDAVSTAWGGNTEKVMTYTSDNSILFYVNCLYYMTQSSSNGLRIKGTAGDYLLLPSLPGKNLTKVVVKHKNADNTHPAIMTRGGNAVVEGGTAEENAAAGDTHTWNLSATAHNMQYRYQLTNGSTAFAYLESLELTYAAKTQIQPLVLNLQFWNNTGGNGSQNQPFTTNISDYTSTDDHEETFTFVSGGENYTFVLGKKHRMRNSLQNRGLGLDGGSYIQLPAIPNYRLAAMEAVRGGSTASSTSEEMTGTGALRLRATPTGEDIKVISAEACTQSSPSSYSATFNGLSAETSYYIVATWGWQYIRNLSLTYLPESPAPSPSSVAPASLLDGGEFEL